MPLLSLAKTFIVNQQQSLKEVLTLAQDGDTIFVEKGIYKEQNVEIKKSIVLIGRDFPVFDGEEKYEIFSVKSPHVVIQGLRIINSGFSSINDLAGIRVYGMNHVRILNNRLENTFFGIYLTNSSNCEIQGNYLIAGKQVDYNIGNGIHLWKCDKIQISYNQIYKHRDGIYFEFVTDSEIRKNYSEGNIRYGLHFMFSHNDLYENNIFKNNGAGVAVMYSKEVRMIKNNFLENWGDAAYGLLLKDIRDSEIAQNQFFKNTIGIYIEGCSRSQFRENNFKENGYAMRLQASCDANTISFNNFMGNTFDLTTNGETVLNKLENNYWDKYEGYDLRRDGVGDVPFHPVSLYAMVLEKIPQAAVLIRSFAVTLLDRMERIIPSLTPTDLRDEMPLMKPIRRQ
ncbi:MAG: right-handed parallel beta-helix repeat-containing protein [Thermoflexibacter sp.]